ncbi:prepilin peptidase [Elusimicrobiota bacterium]
MKINVFNTSMIINIILLLYILISSLTDIIYRKVFNSVTLSAIILGVFLNLSLYGPSGLKKAFLGLLIGFLILFPVYLLGGIGAGDVKFTAAVGAIMGMKFVFFGILYGAVIAGLCSLILLLLKKNLKATISDIFGRILLFFTFKKQHYLKFEKSSLYLPYAALLSIGMLIRWLEITI